MDKPTEKSANCHNPQQKRTRKGKKHTHLKWEQEYEGIIV